MGNYSDIIFKGKNDLCMLTNSICKWDDDNADCRICCFPLVMQATAATIIFERLNNVKEE